MAKDKVTRRLAAIFAADMVGYSRLMEADEEDTIARQKAHRRELIDPKIAEYHGRIVKLMGDGMLVEFASVVEAVRCAVEVQQAMFVREADVPEERRIRYRVGVNLGDIVIDGDDILGDGVNIAARLETLASPGGLCISGGVHDQIYKKLDIRFEDCGEQPVKNISNPIKVFKFRPDDDEAERQGAEESKMPALKLPEKPSIAVLAFDNLSGDPDQEYFSDGVTEDIITELSRYTEFFVIARHSSFAYKGKAVDVRNIARELGVRYILEGSIRRVGNRVRITAQLIDALTGNHVWAERYDRELDDIFALQDEIARNIGGALGASIFEKERSRVLRKAPKSLDAYEHWLRAWALNLKLNERDTRLARQEAEIATSIDPSFAPPYYARAVTELIAMFCGWTNDPSAALKVARFSAQKAVSLDGTSDYAHAILGYTELFLRNYDAALVEGRRAIELNPNQADGYAWLGCTLNFVGQPEEGLDNIKTAIRLNPHQPSWYAIFESRCHYMLGHFENAVAAAKRVVADTPAFTSARALLAASYSRLGRSTEAEAEVARLHEIAPGFTLALVPKVAPYRNATDLDDYLDGLRKAGLPEN